MDELNIFTNVLNEYAKDYHKDNEEINEDDFIRAIYYIDNLYINNEWDVLTYLSSLNLCNAYAKKIKDHDVYKFKKDIGTIIDILNDRKIPNIKICITKDKGKLYIFKVGNIEFSFHDEKDAKIDEYYYEDMTWDGIRKQPCASTIFNNCTNNKNTIKQVTTTGKPIKILINKLIDDYHKNILTFDEILESI